MPEHTLDAVADHGEIQGETVRSRYAHAAQVFAGLAEVGIGYDDVVHVLEEGVEAFKSSWKVLLDSVESSLARLGGRQGAR